MIHRIKLYLLNGFQYLLEKDSDMHIFGGEFNVLGWLLKEGVFLTRWQWWGLVLLCGLV